MTAEQRDRERAVLILAGAPVCEVCGYRASEPGASGSWWLSPPEPPYAARVTLRGWAGRDWIWIVTCPTCGLALELLRSFTLDVSMWSDRTP